MACKSSKKEFIWSDDEAELLLNVVHQYKVRKILEKVDWETVKSKYDDILERTPRNIFVRYRSVYCSFPGCFKLRDDRIR